MTQIDPWPSMNPQSQIPTCYFSIRRLFSLSGRVLDRPRGRGEVARRRRNARTNLNFCSAFSLASTRACTRAALSRLIERSSRRPSTGATRKFKLKFISALHFGRVASLLDELLRAMFLGILALFLHARMISFSLSRCTALPVRGYGFTANGFIAFFLFSSLPFLSV